MPSVFWLAAYNPLLTWAPLTQQAMANDCWAVTFLFQNTPPVERGTCSFTYGMGFCLGTQFFCYELFFLKKCAAATVAKKKKKQKLWKGKRGDELTETEMQTCFGQAQKSWETLCRWANKNLSCRTERTEFWTNVLLCSLPSHPRSQLNRNSFIPLFHVFA